jgi:hypothetical protein
MGFGFAYFAWVLLYLQRLGIARCLLLLLLLRPPMPSAYDDVMGFFLFQRISLVEVAGPKQQALISLSDKRDVGFLAKGLVDLGYNRVFCFLCFFIVRRETQCGSMSSQFSVLSIAVVSPVSSTQFMI